MGGRRIVFGVGPVRELLSSRSGQVACLYVASLRSGKSNDPVAELVSRAKHAEIPVSELSREELDRLVDGNHQGVIAVAGEYEYAALEDVLERAQNHPPGLIVALDSVTDPHNLGAVLRSAYLLGAHGVVVPKDRSSRMTATVAKASAGASERIDVAQVTNLARALSQIKEAGLWVAAIASGPKAQPLWSLQGATPLCLLLGSEGAGLRPLVAKQADFSLEIPMAGSGVGSFNVSVAAAIALYEVSRQRNA